MAKNRSCKVLTLIASVWLPVDLRKNLELGTQKVEKWVFAFFNTLQSFWINGNNLGSLKCILSFNLSKSKLISRGDLACGPSHLSYLVAHAFFNSLVHHWELHIWIRKCYIDQRHNGPEGWVLLTKVTCLGHITSSFTNLDQISSSESRPSINLNISTKHQPLHKT